MHLHYWKAELYKTLCCDKDIVEVCSEIYAYSTNSSVINFDQTTDLESDKEIFKFTTTLSLRVNSEIEAVLKELDGIEDADYRQYQQDKVMLTTVSALFMQQIILIRSAKEWPKNEMLETCAA